MQNTSLKIRSPCEHNETLYEVLDITLRNRQVIYWDRGWGNTARKEIHMKVWNRLYIDMGSYCVITMTHETFINVLVDIIKIEEDNFGRMMEACIKEYGI